MLLIRRIWLLPTVLLFLVFYYFWHNSTPRVQIGLSPIGTDIQQGYGTDALHVVILPERFPVKNFAAIPAGKAKKLPRIQHEFSTETAVQKEERLARLNTIKDAFTHTWHGYRKYAWRQDEVAPLSGSYRNPFGGWGATLVDSLSTLWIMGLKEDFEEAVAAVKEIDFSTSHEEVINVFETTIRYLGGLLGAYDVSDHKYPVLLAKAIELANILYIAFDTENRMPMTRWRWRDSARGMPVKASRGTLLAEMGSLTVEFTRLAQLTGNNKWFDAVDRLTDLLYRTQDSSLIPGLWPVIVDTVDGDFSTWNSFTLGGMADSTYEYLVKQYILLGGLDDRYQEMYDKAIKVAKNHLFFRPLVPGNQPLLMSGNAAIDNDGVIQTEAQGQHLTCFTGGMVAMAAKIFERHDEMTVAKQLVDGCIWAYNSTPSGLMPELFHITPCDPKVSASDLYGCEWSEEKWYAAVTREHPEAQEGETQATTGRRIVEEELLLPAYSKWSDPRYILRPEAIESVFYYYRITGDRTYLDEAWRMWSSIDLACRTPIAFAALADVRNSAVIQSDRMESFWLAETLKYFFLIYSEPNDWSLDDWVFNTEAHLLRRPRAGEPLNQAEDLRPMSSRPPIKGKAKQIRT